MGAEEDLKENAKEYFRNGLFMQERNQINSAVTLFFKTISTLADLLILNKEGKIPSNHSERFRILEKKYKEVYDIIDKDFPFYQNSYRTKLNKEISKMFENDAKKLFEILGIRI